MKNNFLHNLIQTFKATSFPYPVIIVEGTDPDFGNSCLEIHVCDIPKGRRITVLEWTVRIVADVEKVFDSPPDTVVLTFVGGRPSLEPLKAYEPLTNVKKECDEEED